MKKKPAILIALIVVAVIISIVVVTNLSRSSKAIPSPNGNSTTENSTTEEPSGKPPDTSNWISPGKLYVEDYEPGQTKRLEIRVHNGNSYAAEFSVDYRYPDHLGEGYNKPTGVSDWVKVKEKFPLIGANTTYTAIVWLHMPSDAESPGNKWEFWIGVIDKSQGGNIITELAIRVLVSMK